MDTDQNSMDGKAGEKVSTW